MSPFIPLARCLSYSSEDVAKVFVCMVGDLLIVEESYTLGSVSFKLTSFSPELMGFVLSSTQKGLVSFVSNGLHSVRSVIVFFKDRYSWFYTNQVYGPFLQLACRLRDLFDTLPPLRTVWA